MASEGAKPTWRGRMKVADFSQDMLDRLIAGPVPRADIAASLATTASVSIILSGHARRMQPPHLVKRHIKGADISYRLRPAVAGEVAGQVKEA